MSLGTTIVEDNIHIMDINNVVYFEAPDLETKKSLRETMGRVSDNEN